MLRPPTTNDPALNRFLEEVASTIQDRVRPEEGWTLSDFASSVSEVISDKRDLIDIVTQYDNIEGLSEVMEAEIARLKADIQESMYLLSSVNSKSVQFAEMMAWWDQNYTIIFDAQEALSIFQEIHGAMAESQDLLSQTTAAKEAAEQAAAGIIAADSSAEASAEAAKTSETNATNAAARAAASETEVSEAREYVSGVHESWLPGGDRRADLEALANATVDATGQAVDARDAAAGHADRAEVAADGVDQVVSNAAGALAAQLGDVAQEVADNADAAQAARDQAAASATTAEGHADRAATEAGAAAQIAAAEKIATLVGSAPAELDTIYELAAAFADRGDAIAAVQDALANRVMGNHTSVIASTPPGAGTPTNQVTFVVEGA